MRARHARADRTVVWGSQAMRSSKSETFKVPASSSCSSYGIISSRSSTKTRLKVNSFPPVHLVDIAQTGHLVLDVYLS